MPREYAHINLCYELVSDINKDFIFDEKLNSYFYLGSISPDSGYYDILNIFGYKKGDYFSEFIHENFEDNLISLSKKIIENSKDEPEHMKDILLSFSLGMISHAMLDNLVHPLVNLISGDYYNPDLAKRSQSRYTHRRLETILDFKILNNNKNLENLILYNPKRELGINLISKYLLKSLKSIGFKAGILGTANLLRFWSTHIVVFKLFSNPNFYNFNARQKIPLSRENKALYFDIREEEFLEITKDYNGQNILDLYNSSIVKIKSDLSQIAKELKILSR